MSRTNEPEATAHRDWRLQAIVALARPFTSRTTGITYPVGTPIEPGAYVKLDGELRGIRLPSAPALYVSLARRHGHEAQALRASLEASSTWEVMHDGVLKVTEANESKLFDFFESIVASVICAYTALETFANESIPEGFEHVAQRADKRCTETYDKAQVERHVTLDVKLDTILPKIFSAPSPKGEKAWQNYIWLKRLRDRLIHLKSSDWRDAGPEQADESLWTALFEKRATRVYAIPLDLVRHFKRESPPRWLSQINDD